MLVKLKVKRDAPCCGRCKYLCALRPKSLIGFCGNDDARDVALDDPVRFTTSDICTRYIDRGGSPPVEEINIETQVAGWLQQQSPTRCTDAK
jgi:hypothetical protein